MLPATPVPTRKPPAAGAPCAVRVLVLIALGPISLSGATRFVATEQTLAAALAAASAGDEIVVRDGTYHGNFSLARSGVAGRAIVVRAEHPLQATFSTASLELKGDHGIVRDFVFERSQVSISGNFNEVAHSLFRDSGDARRLKAAVWTSGGASHNRIHHNELTRWSTFGFRVWQPNAHTTGNRIDHNYIHDYSNRRSSNEPEVFQVGSSQEASNLPVATVIEYNLVERVAITGELLSLKSSGNLVRGNTFVDIHGAVQGRHGCNNTFLNNTLLGGKTVLRAYGDDHRLIGNRLVGVDLMVSPGDVTQDALRKVDGHGTHPASRHQWVVANLLEEGGRIVIGQGLRDSYVMPAENTMVVANVGPVVTDGEGFNQSGTKRVADYGGDTGQPVVMTRAQVGPGAPDPVVASPAVRGRSWQEDFARGMDRWWSEGGERVWVQDGRLQMWADKPEVPGGGVATAWCRELLPDNFDLQLQAQVVSSSRQANNINLFLCYADPTGRPLEETREKRRSADYNLYHGLNGYIITFLNEEGAARVRVRRNPGFHLLAEARVGECRAGVTYRLNVTKQDGDITFQVDGRELARVTDAARWHGGLLGLRTFRTNLWWDNIRVESRGDPR